MNSEFLETIYKRDCGATAKLLVLRGATFSLAQTIAAMAWAQVYFDLLHPQEQALAAKAARIAIDTFRRHRRNPIGSTVVDGGDGRRPNGDELRELLREVASMKQFLDAGHT